MRLKKYIGEGREEAIKSKQSEFKNLGLTFHPKWEDFVKKNMKVIKSEEDKIKKIMNSITGQRNQNKYFKREMKDLLNKMTGLWGAMK